MFDLTKIAPVLEHLKQISPNTYRTSPKEIVIHCPFCDDATRAGAMKHGHLYVATEFPVFNCFRCNSSGTLIGLLLQTGFEDRSVIEYISQFIKINFTKDYYKMRNRRALFPRFSHLKKGILEYNKKFKRNHYDQYIQYLNYIDERIGTDINASEFLLSPLLFDGFLTCRFTNYIGENVSIRYIDEYKNRRYVINKNTSNLYYFQDLTKKNKITISEGPFDIINLYLYNDIFRDNTFISINGKNYINNIEKLILMYYLLDELEINIVFDRDFAYKYKKLKKSLNQIIQVYNGKITLNLYSPLIGDDVAEFPAVIKLGD